MVPPFPLPVVPLSSFAIALGLGFHQRALAIAPTPLGNRALPIAELSEQWRGLTEGSLVFLPPQPVGTPGRREPAGTNFAPPQDLDVPPRQEGVSTRGERCAQLLLPTFRDGQGSAATVYGYGKTVSDRPKLYLNLNSDSGEVNLRITLFKKGQSEPIARIQRRYATASGLYEVDLFSAAEGDKQDEPLTLEMGTTYTLNSEVACANEITQGWSYVAEQGVIQRVVPGAELGNQLASATDALERVQAFALEGLWVDLMTEVVDVARDRPNDPLLVSVWRSILRKLQSDFDQEGSTPTEPGVTTLFFQKLQDTSLVVVDSDANN